MDHLQLISETCVLQHLRAAARRVTQMYEAALKPVDLTASQFAVLVAVARHEDVAISALAQRLDMDRTTLTRVLRPLQKRGLLRVGGARADARQRAVRLEPAGQALLSSAEALWDAAQARALAQVGEADWPKMRSRLNALGKS